MTTEDTLWVIGGLALAGFAVSTLVSNAHAKYFPEQYTRGAGMDAQSEQRTQHRSTRQMAQGIGNAASYGATVGSALGPAGTIVGGGVGALTGAIYTGALGTQTVKCGMGYVYSAQQKKCIKTHRYGSY